MASCSETEASGWEDAHVMEEEATRGPPSGSQPWRPSPQLLLKAHQSSPQRHRAVHQYGTTVLQGLPNPVTARGRLRVSSTADGSQCASVSGVQEASAVLTEPTPAGGTK